MTEFPMMLPLCSPEWFSRVMPKWTAWGANLWYDWLTSSCDWATLEAISSCRAFMSGRLARSPKMSSSVPSSAEFGVLLATPPACCFVVVR